MFLLDIVFGHKRRIEVGRDMVVERRHVDVDALGIAVALIADHTFAVGRGFSVGSVAAGRCGAQDGQDDAA